MHTRLTWTVDLDGHRARSHQAEVAFEDLNGVEGYRLSGVRLLDRHCDLTTEQVGEDAMLAVAAESRRRHRTLH
ncbi:hypothetical protein [Azospirillum sp. A39]|uniref:hypothetical protein n=1 Tax=Azospirillum sp. A39 TaxID=3462279 RepID=UPI0040452132